MQTAPPYEHIWYTAAACAEALDARKCGAHWRAKCPAHAGKNPTSLKIGEGLDRYGNPCTTLHCFAQGCHIEDICAAMGMKVNNLFSVDRHYARDTQTNRTHSPRLAQVK